MIGLALALALLADAPAAPPPAAPAMVHHGPPPPDSVTGDHASLPMTFTAGLPTIAVTIDGKGPFKVGVDTGAMGGVHMTDRLAAALGLTPFGEARASDPSGLNPVAVKLYRLDDFKLGGVEVKGWVSSAAPSRPGKLESLDAIVGIGAFAGYVVTIDYAGARFAIDRGALPPPDGQHVFGYDDVLPVVPLSVEGHSIRAHLDTGNVRFPVIVPAGFAEALAHHAEARSIGQAHTVSNVIDMFAMPVDGAVQVGAASVGANEVGYPSIIDMANIGSLALGRMVVRVDPANKRISLVSLDEVSTAGRR
ncbi:MAG: hypothetical protein JWO81_90 [Alphaproteobacteria bacterium]|nr:hypothetical protein [Alphaproteobacteria bacterium]